jgi:ABC-type uncharacterized transport system auxiliary subunit
VKNRPPLSNGKALLKGICIFTIMLILSGCGYSILKKSDIPANEVYIGKINNKTFEPKLQDKLYKVLGETLGEYGFEINSAARYRLEADIKKFEIKTISEKDLITTEYLIILSCDFRLIDSQTGNVNKIGGISDPFTKYFISKGKLENVLAQKEIATESSMRDISRELIRYIIHKSVERK